MRSDDGGDNWHEISGNLPSDFGFPIGVHAHEPDTIYVIPIKSDSEHNPPEGKLRVYRSRSGGHDWEPLTKGLPQEDCYVNVYRDAMAIDTLDECGIYFGTTGGQVYASPDAGDKLGSDCAGSSGGVLGRGTDSLVIRVRLPHHLRTLAGVGTEIELDVDQPVTQRSVLTALEAEYPVLMGTIRDRHTHRRRPFVRFFACEQDLSNDDPDDMLPAKVASGAEAYYVVGAMAGG